MLRLRLRMFAEYENEENVLVCLRIIIELHKQFRPAHSQEHTSLVIRISKCILCPKVQQSWKGYKVLFNTFKKLNNYSLHVTPTLNHDASMEQQSLGRQLN